MVDVVGRGRVIVETLIEQQQAKKAGEKAGEAAADGVADGGKQAGSKFSDQFEGIVGKSLPLAAAGVGAAVGVVIADQIGKNLEREANAARLGASLGLTGAETAELNRTSARIYREAWGASFEEVQQGVAAVKSSFQDLRGQELTDAARSARIFADIFEVDVVQAAGVASVAVKNGLAADAVEAFDLMTAAAQQVPLQFRDELLEAVTEYSQFFTQIGVDGPEAFALLAQAAEQGQYGIDKTGDAIKEFGIRAIDTSATTIEAFEKLNLPLAEMQTALAGGGEEAEEAFRKIVQGLDDIEDPAEQAQTAIALFGAPLEDLGNENIPKFIDALANANTELGNYRGAARKAGEQSGTLKTQLTSLARYLEGGFGDALAGAGRGIGRLYDAWIKLPSRLRGQVTGDDVPDAPDISQPRETRASGGPVSGLALVGEQGPELVRFPNGSYVHNANDTADMLSGAGGGTVINLNNYGPVSGADLVSNAKWADRFGSRMGALTVSVVN